MSEAIRSVERALEVLMCFSNKTPELSMTEISEMVGINKSTIHRLLATLEGKRFVERNPDNGLYRPGIRFIQIAFLTIDHNDLKRVATPFMKSLCNQYQENVNLTILDDDNVVYVEVIESEQRIKLAATPGQHLPAFCTASGKAILAFMPEKEVSKILERGMPKYTSNTINSPKSYFEDISMTRERGFAISEQEFEEGINAVAAPIFNDEQKPIASVSIAGPAYRCTLERMIKIGLELISVTTDIAKEMKVEAN